MYSMVDRRLLKGERMASQKSGSSDGKSTEAKSVTRLAGYEVRFQPPTPEAKVQMQKRPQPHQKEVISHKRHRLPSIAGLATPPKNENETAHPKLDSVYRHFTDIFTARGKSSARDPLDTSQYVPNYTDCSSVHTDSNEVTYLGETSIVSFLYECRSMFASVLGPVKFCDDVARFPLDDKPLLPGPGVLPPLLKREETDLILHSFQTNVNCIFPVFEPGFIKEYIVDVVYNSPFESQVKPILILFYGILALGQLNLDFLNGDVRLERSHRFFECAVHLLKETPDEGELWSVQANYLIAYYYHSTYRKATAWIYLNLAIGRALTLGLHRKHLVDQQNRQLFCSLYMFDKINGICIGRPFVIKEGDWDDIHTSKKMAAPYESLGFFIEELEILTDIINSFYRGNNIEVEAAKSIVADFRKWNHNQNKVLDPASHPLTKDQMYVWLLMQFSLLHGISLLARPFVMYDISCKRLSSQGTLDKDFKEEMVRLSTRCSILCIKLLDFFTKTSDRVVLCLMLDVTFCSGLLLGLRLLFDDDNELFDMVTLSTDLMNRCSSGNMAAKRYALVLGDMVSGLLQRKPQLKGGRNDDGDLFYQLKTLLG